jgi:hypothetical protein
MATDLSKINLNDKVGVELTDHGIGVWAAHYALMYAELEAGGLFVKVDHKVKLPPKDKYGLRWFSLWEVMRIFGNEMRMGTPNQCFVANTLHRIPPV